MILDLANNCKNKPYKKFNVLDFFCGCGGLSKGFEDANYNVVLGIDNDSAALDTFKRNHHETETLNASLADTSTLDKIEALLNETKVDVIVGGPPCQGFSLSGPRNFEDGRNTLYMAMLNAVQKFSPQAFIIENVPGMATLYKGEVKKEILKKFCEMGYTVNTQVLCASDFGVPQMRNRLFFVGLKSGFFEFPAPSHTPENYVSCEDAISDLPSREIELGCEIDEYIMPPQSKYQELMRKNQDKLYNHIATNHTQMVKDVISYVPEGGNYKDLPEGVGTNRKFNEAWTRYHSKKPSKTIDTGHRNHFHYKYNRVPTIRENARLQSFKDTFVFFGTKTQQNRQVGNAVPPLLGKAIAQQLLKYLVVE